MIYSAVASRYASALFNVSKTAKKTEEYKSALSALSQIYDSIAVFLNNQALKPELRARFLVDVLKGLGMEIDENFERFLLLLISNKRFKFIKQIAAHFDFVVLDDQGMIPVNVVTASDLSPEEEKLIGRLVEKHTGRKPVFQKTVDKELIAGIVLEFAGKKLDASIRGRLQEMARSLRKG